MKHLALAVALTFASGCTQVAMQRCGPWTTVVDGLDLQSSRSWTHDGNDHENWGIMTVLVNMTAQNTVTRVDMACTGSPDGNTTDIPLSECTVSSGACTVDDATWQKTVAAADAWGMRVDVEGIDAWTCTMSVGAGSGTATDVISVYARVCTKG